MERSIDEKLFFRMMQFNRIMRRNMVHGHHGPGERHKGPGKDNRCGCEGERGHFPPAGERYGKGPHCGGHSHEKMRAFAQARLLSQLLEHEDGVRQKVLAEEMKINPSSTSELISKLEAEGYIVRTVDPGDKRATLISLTEVGRARAYELEDERAERFGRFFVNLSESEKEQLLGLLEKVMDVLEEEE